MPLERTPVSQDQMATWNDKSGSWIQPKMAAAPPSMTTPGAVCPHLPNDLIVVNASFNEKAQVFSCTLICRTHPFWPFPFWMNTSWWPNYFSFHIILSFSSLRPLAVTSGFYWKPPQKKRKKKRRHKYFCLENLEKTHTIFLSLG